MFFGIICGDFFRDKLWQPGMYREWTTPG